MHFTIVRMAVPPEGKLLQDEKSDDAEQESAENRPRIEGDERLRQKFQKRDAEQGTDRVADERGNEPGPATSRHEQERRSDRKSAEPAEQAEAESDGEQAHATGLYPARYDATYPRRARTR